MMRTRPSIQINVLCFFSTPGFLQIIFYAYNVTLRVSSVHLQYSQLSPGFGMDSLRVHLKLYGVTLLHVYGFVFTSITVQCMHIPLCNSQSSG